MILAAVFWGTNFAATKFAALSIPLLLLVAFRFWAGGHRPDWLYLRPEHNECRQHGLDLLHGPRVGHAL